MKVSVVKPIWVDDPDYIFGTDGRGAPLLSLFAENRSAKSSGWWFQRFFIFHFIYGMSSFPLTNSIIFQRGRAQPPSNHIFSHFSTYRHSMWQFYKTVTFYSGILTYHSFLLRTRELAHGLAPWYLERPGLFCLKRYLNVGCCLRRQSWTGPLVFECFR